MRKIITFLGVYPKTTQYQYRDKVYQGDVFAEALHQFEDYDKMLVFVTPEAGAKAWPVLERLEDDRIAAIEIPRGESTEEMWQIFEALTNAVDEGDSVIFDITHGLRSLPFLVFLAAAFLKSARQVEIEGIYYGALELQKDQNGNPRPAPVIELSEFVGLLDWLNASDQFIRTGNASSLASQLRAARPQYNRHQSTPGALQQSKQIKRAADALEDTSRALRLILPDQAMEASETLQGVMGAAAAAIQRWARPFTVLGQRVTDAYAPLALGNPRSQDNLIASLNRERQLVQWYLERNQLVQAIAVAREWLVTWGLLSAGFTDVYDRELREKVEEVFGEANRQSRQRHGDYDDLEFSNGRQLPRTPLLDQILELYARLGNVRNTLLHAGKRPAQDPAESLERQIRQLCQELQNLPIPNPDDGESL